MGWRIELDTFDAHRTTTHRAKDAQVRATCGSHGAEHLVAHAEFAFSPQWEPTTVAFDVALDDCVDGTLSLVVVNGDGATSRAYRVDLPSLFDRPRAARGRERRRDARRPARRVAAGHGRGLEARHTAAWPEAEAQLPS